MFVRYGLAAVLAALATLMGTVVWAQDSYPQGGFSTGYAPPAVSLPANSCPAKDCCATGTCCKDGKCCKDEKCCNSKKCDASCSCCKDNKCECGKGKDCCCKDGKCSCKGKTGCCGKTDDCCTGTIYRAIPGTRLFQPCGKVGECCCTDGKCGCKGKAKVKKTAHAACPFLGNLAKGTAIIMVMPASLPLLGACHPEVMGMMPHPPMPIGPHVMLPPPPPMLTPPGLPVPTMTPPVMPPHTIAMPVPAPAPCYPCPTAMPVLCAPTPDATATVSKGNVQVETCLQLLGMASELCSVVRPTNTPALCLSALEMLMEMCPARYTHDATANGGGYGAPYSTPLPAPSYVNHPPQYMPPSPPFPFPRELNAQEAAAACPYGCPGPSCPVSISAGTPCCPASSCPVSMSAGTQCCAPCVPTTTTTAAKVRIIATPSDDKLEMNVGDATCIRCKKMTVKIGDNDITLSRFDDRVRVRGEELKATAGSVRSDRKDHLILEGDVVLHFKKDGHSANVTGERIELNLSSGAITIKPAAKTTVRPAVRIERVDTDE